MNKTFDSNEEKFFSWYIRELQEANYIYHIEYQPESYHLSRPQIHCFTKPLKTKTKLVSVTLLREHVYTPDFRILWEQKARGLFFNNHDDKVDLRKTPFITNSTSNSLSESLIEIKPVFDQNNMTRLFSINQKWLYHHYNTYVQKIIPVKLFEQTFVPQKYLLTDKTNKPRKLKFQPRTLNEFLSQKQKRT